VPVGERTCVVDQHIDAGAAECRRSTGRSLIQLLLAPQQVEGQHAVPPVGGLPAVVCCRLRISTHREVLNATQAYTAFPQVQCMSNRTICTIAINRNAEVPGRLTAQQQQGPAATHLQLLTPPR
jgi:hypothetical protein